MYVYIHILVLFIHLPTDGFPLSLTIMKNAKVKKK